MSARKRNLPPQRDGDFIYKLILGLGVLTWLLNLFHFARLNILDQP